jgi:hypothetical protein
LHFDSHVDLRAIDDGVGFHLAGQVLLDFDAEARGLAGVSHVLNLAAMLQVTTSWTMVCTSRPEPGQCDAAITPVSSSMCKYIDGFSWSRW